MFNHGDDGFYVTVAVVGISLTNFFSVVLRNKDGLNRVQLRFIKLTGIILAGVFIFGNLITKWFKVEVVGLIKSQT